MSPLSPPSAPSTSCVLCGSEAPTHPRTGDNETFECPRCGYFKASGSLVARLRVHSPLENPQKAYASSWLRERAPATSTLGLPPFTLSTTHESLLRSARPPAVADQADRVLAELARQHSRPGQIITIDFRRNLALQALSWSVDDNDLFYLVVDYLVQEQGYLFVAPTIVPHPHNPLPLRVTPRGWAYIQSGGVARSVQGFIAMWFHPSTEELRERGLKPAIERAGYRAFIIDESLRNKPIDAEIIANIRRSRLLVADVHYGDSVPRGGVYFEAGYAMGHNIPVFWTCKDTDLRDGRIHFDVRQNVFTPWTAGGNWEPFVKRLSTFIEANEGAGPLKDLSAGT